MRYLKSITLITLLTLSFLGSTLALDHNADGVFVRVVDVGAGLCVVVKMPEDYYMVYDAGNYEDNGKTAIKGILEIIPEDEEIDLLVLSHSDSDHLAAVPRICRKYTVNMILRTGFERDGIKTWDKAVEAIEEEVEIDGAIDLNLGETDVPPGTTYDFGDVSATVVAGLHKPPVSWGSLDDSEKRNSVSIVVRLQYKGKSILFTGDTVGRHRTGPPDQCIAAEEFMAENANTVAIDSDVMIAPHHGGNNAGSTKFIRAVSPEYVIFSAGHKHKHPRASAAKRYTKNGVDRNNMFRTDLGDDEGGPEWKFGRKKDHVDPKGDDDVDILIRPDGEVVVEYRNN